MTNIHFFLINISLFTSLLSIYSGSYIDHGTSRSKRDDWAMWTDEASGMYSAYLSIAEEGTSSRARLNANYILKITLNVVPLPTSLITSIDPPISSTICFTIDRPRPVEFVFLFLPLSTM